MRVILLLLIAGYATADPSTVLRKVVELLQDLKTTAEKEGKEDDSMFEKQKLKLNGQIDRYSDEIDTKSGERDDAKLAIESASSKIEAKEGEIKDANLDMTNAQQEIKSGNSQHEAKLETATGLLADYRECHQQMTKAVADFRKEDFDQTVIDVLDGVKKDCESKSNQAQKDLNDLKHNHNMNIDNLKNKDKNADKKKSDATKVLNENKETKADNEAAKAALIQNIEKKESLVKKLKSELKTLTEEYEERRKLREDEATAISEAIEILSGDAANTLSARTALLQIGSMHPASTRSMVQYLEKRGSAIHSDQLIALANQVAATSGPFDKVKDMITSLIKRLEEEARAEAEHNAFCKQELAANEQERDAQSTTVSEKNAQIDKLEAEIETHAAEIKKFADSIAKTQEDLADAQKLRNEAKALYEKIDGENKEAEQALKDAVRKLTDFYGGASKDNVGKDGKFGGTEGGRQILSILEDTVLAELQTEMKANDQTEKDAVNAFDDTKTDFNKSINSDKKDKVNEESGKTEKESEKTNADDERTTAQNLLDNAEAQFQKLRPVCLEGGPTPEERFKQREEEIQSLNDALEILENAQSA